MKPDDFFTFYIAGMCGFGAIWFIVIGFTTADSKRDIFDDLLLGILYSIGWPAILFSVIFYGIGKLIRKFLNRHKKNYIVN